MIVGRSKQMCVRQTSIMQEMVSMRRENQRRVLVLESPTSNVGIVLTFKMIVIIEGSVLKIE